MKINPLFLASKTHPNESSHRTCRTAAAELSVPVFGSAGCTGCSGTSELVLLEPLSQCWSLIGGVGGLYGVVEGTVSGGWNVCFRYHFILMPFHFSFGFTGFVTGTTSRVGGVGSVGDLELLVSLHINPCPDVPECYWRVGDLGSSGLLGSAGTSLCWGWWSWSLWFSWFCWLFRFFSWLFRKTYI